MFRLTSLTCMRLVGTTTMLLLFFSTSSSCGASFTTMDNGVSFCVCKAPLNACVDPPGEEEKENDPIVLVLPEHDTHHVIRLCLEDAENTRLQSVSSIHQQGPHGVTSTTNTSFIDCSHFGCWMELSLVTSHLPSSLDNDDDVDGIPILITATIVPKNASAPNGLLALNVRIVSAEDAQSNSSAAHPMGAFAVYACLSGMVLTLPILVSYWRHHRSVVQQQKQQIVAVAVTRTESSMVSSSGWRSSSASTLQSMPSGRREIQWQGEEEHSIPISPSSEDTWEEIVL